MRPVIYAVATMWLYALHNVIIRERLKEYDPLAIAALFYLGALPLVIIVLLGKRFAGLPIVWPTDPYVIAWAFFGGALYLSADYLYLSAYNTGGEVVVVTTIVILLPVFSVIVQSAWNKTWVLPDRWEVIGYLLILAGLAALVKGGALKQAAERVIAAG